MGNFRVFLYLRIMKIQFFNLILLNLILWAAVPQVGATHGTGGYMRHEKVGTSGNSSIYKISVYLYRDRTQDGTKDEVPFDNDLWICIYKNGKMVDDTLVLPMIFKKQSDGDMAACAKTGWAPTDYAIYSGNVTLLNSADNYVLKWERCCRVMMDNLKNSSLSLPYQGIRYETTINTAGDTNKNALHKTEPVKVMCQMDTTEFDFSMTDSDGDSLSYEWTTPYQGASSANPIQTMCAANYVNPTLVDYISGYDASAVFGSGSYNTLDAVTGKARLYSLKEGIYAIAYKVTEWRNGKVIASTIVNGSVYVRDRNKPAVTLGVDDLKPQLSVYPNPVKEKLNIAAAPLQLGKIRIINAQGALIYEGKFENKMEINTEAWANGIYTLLLNDAHQQIAQRFVVMHN